MWTQGQKKNKKKLEPAPSEQGNLQY
jgi:hypothetical protein